MRRKKETRTPDSQVLAFKLIIWGVSPLNLAGDEALFWLYTKHMSLAYFTKGPVIAWVVQLGTILFGHTEFGVRFGSLVCSVIFAAIFCIYAHAHYPKTAWRTCLVLFTSPFFISLGIGTNTDPACFMFWLAGIVCSWEAIAGKRYFWLVAWFAFGLGVLTKYSALAAPVSLVLYLIYFRRKDILLSRSFLLGILLFLLSLSPLVIWNYNNGWANFAHNAGHLGVNSKEKINFAGPFEMIATFLVVMGGIGIVILLKQLYSSRKIPFSVFTIWMAFPLAAMCLCASFFHKVYPNWPMALGFMAALGALPASWVARKWYNIAIGTNVAIAVVAGLLLCDIHPGIPQTSIATKKLIGWKELGNRVDELRDKNEFILTSRYDTASLIAFYSTLYFFVPRLRLLA